MRRYTVYDLKNELNRRNLSYSGTKAELEQRLRQEVLKDLKRGDGIAPNQCWRMFVPGAGLNKELMLEAVKENGRALRYASDELKNGEGPAQATD